MTTTANTSPSNTQGAPGAGRPRFRRRDLVLFAVIAAISVAIYYGLTARGAWWPMFAMLVAAMPLVLLAFMQAGDHISRWLAREDREDREAREDRE